MHTFNFGRCSIHRSRAKVAFSIHFEIKKIQFSRKITGKKQFFVTFTVFRSLFRNFTRHQFFVTFEDTSFASIKMSFFLIGFCKNSIQQEKTGKKQFSVIFTVFRSLFRNFTRHQNCRKFNSTIRGLIRFPISLIVFELQAK